MYPFPLISAHALRAILNNPTPTTPVILIDASYSLSAGGETPFQKFCKSRIENAVFFDIDAISDHTSHLPHMVPSPEQFGRQAGELGLSNDHHIIVYDQTGIGMAACRVWWMLRLFGHTHVQILDGGLPAWLQAGYATNINPPLRATPALFNTTFHRELIATMEDMDEAIAAGSSIIIDARPNPRFMGIAPEPRPDLYSGHMPTAHNVPATSLIDQRTGCLLPADALRVILSPLPRTMDQRIITSCGSGVTACVDALAYSILGYDKVAIYDGSWAEWGQKTLNKPIINHSV